MLIGEYPLAVDFPNHAARLFIECNLSDPALSRMYAVEYSLIPNLAIDLLYQPLCEAVDPMTFLRGTLVLTMAGILSVVWMLHSFLNKRRSNAFVLLAPAMTFNLVTSMGYLNYLIGTFLFLLFVWVTLRFEVLRKHPVLAIAVPNIFGGLIFLCHIFALALAGIFLFGLRFAIGSGQPLLKRFAKAAILSAASFAVPLVMLLLAERSGFGFSYPLAGKFRALWAPLLYSSVTLAAALSFLWVALFYVVSRERLISIADVMRWPIALLLAFCVALPFSLLNAIDVDSRCLVSVLFLVIASIGVAPAAGSSPKLVHRGEVAAAILAGGTICLQVAITSIRAQVYDRQVSEFRRAIVVIPPSTSVLPTVNLERDPPMHANLYWHLASYATLDRKAFNPFEFTGVGMQPLRPQPHYQCIDIDAGQPTGVSTLEQLMQPSILPAFDLPDYADLRYAYRWNRNFDYVIVTHFGADSNPVPARLRPVHHGSFFTIYRTLKTASSDGPCSPGGRRL